MYNKHGLTLALVVLVSLFLSLTTQAQTEAQDEVPADALTNENSLSAAPTAVSAATDVNLSFTEYKQSLITAKQGCKDAMAKEGKTACPCKVRLGVEVLTNDSLIGSKMEGAPKGARITWVMAGSPAQKYGVEVADIVHEINHVPVTDAGMFIQNVFGAGKWITLKIERNGKILKKRIKLPKDPTTYE